MSKKLTPIDADWKEKLAERISSIIYNWAMTQSNTLDITSFLTAIKIMREVQRTLDSLPED
jgi:uncharacterized protein YfeS